VGGEEGPISRCWVQDQRKLAGLGFAGAEDMTICFSSAGRQGEKAVILYSEMAGEWVLMCVCVRL